MSSAIQKVEEQGGVLALLETPEWPRAVLEIVKRQSCPKGMPDDEFYVFAKKCQQTGLNPLTGEALCVPRNDKNKGVIYTFTPTAEGMRSRAGRFPDFLKCDGAAVYENDNPALVDTGSGEVKHAFNAAKPRGRLTGAWGRVVKRGGGAVVTWLPVGSRSGSSTFWQQDAGSMLTKCAIVAALRQAYPVAFSGVYAREEMPEESAEPSRTEQVLSAASGAAPTTEPKALPAVGPSVAFGAWKHRPIEALTVGEAKEAICFANAKIAESPKAKWVKQMAENRDAIAKAHGLPPDLKDADAVEAELVSNEPSEEEKAAILAQERALAEREPGSEG